MKKLRGKRLLILGSNVYKDIIKQIADYYGITLVFARLYPGELDEIANEVYTIDTTNGDLMIPFIKSHNIDGVYMGASELIISSSCDYVAKAGLPCICHPKQWIILQNKKLFKQLCLKHNLPVVPEFDINQPDTIIFPVIVKPVDGSGSEGLSECNSLDELEVAYEKAKQASSLNKAIIEKKVFNNAIYAYYTITNGEVSLDLTEDTYAVKEQNKSFTKSLYLAPSKCEDAFNLQFSKKIEALFQSIDIKNGDVWFEVFHNDNSFYFNECGFRPAGHKSMYPVQYFSEINQIASVIYFSLTGEGCRINKPSLIPATITFKERYCIYPIHCKVGVVKDIEINDEIYRQHSILLVSIQRNIGDVIEDDTSFYSILGFIHFIYKDAVICKNLITDIRKWIKVWNEKGENMIKQSLDLNDHTIVY